MKHEFPRTTVGGVSLSRMIIGTNWLAGWSHTTPAADKTITGHHNSSDSVKPVFETFLAKGIDTVMGPFGVMPHVTDAIYKVREKAGRDFIMIDTPP